jgi:hypothetical protein
MNGSARIALACFAALGVFSSRCASYQTVTTSSSESGMSGAASAIGGNSCTHGDCEFNDRYQPCCDRYKECGENKKNLSKCDACIACIDNLSDNPEGCAKKFSCGE